MKDPYIELSTYLDEGEELLWNGKPKQGIIFTKVDIVAILFGLFFCGMGIFLLTRTLPKGSPIPFQLFGIPFVISGIYYIFGRFIWNIKVRENTVYGITNKRVIIKSGIFTRKFVAINIKALYDMELEEKADGSGNISFGPKVPFQDYLRALPFLRGRHPYSTAFSPAFEFISDVQNIYRRITELQKNIPKN